jgi:flagellin
MKISFNASAVIANNSLTKNDNKLAQSLERLSSGLKIVNAKDNPSGLAMSKRMNAQIKGLSAANENSNDGISIIEIADGTMSEIHEMLQRINELCVKASNGTMLDEDREMVNDEIVQLKEEIERIASETEFNGQKILDGSFDLKGYTSDIDMKVAYYSDQVFSGTYTIEALNIASYNADGTINTDTMPTATFGDGFPDDAAISLVDGNTITITGSNDFEVKINVYEKTAFSKVELDLEGFGAMDMQIGANEGQQLAIRIPKVSLDLMGISNIDVSTQESAQDALSRMGGAVQYVSDVRSRLGAYQNRLEHTINSLDISNVNMTAAYSRIMDVDMAAEMTEYTTLQVLSQASTSMLAQANERPAQVLQLLQ